MVCSSDRRMSARARKRQKDTINELLCQTRDFTLRNGRLEQLGRAFASVSSALSDENRRLREYIVRLHSTGALHPHVPPPVDNSLHTVLASILTQLAGLVSNSGTSQQPDHQAALHGPISQQTIADVIPEIARMVGLPIHQLLSSTYDGQQRAPSAHPTMESVPDFLLTQLLAHRRATMAAEAAVQPTSPAQLSREIEQMMSPRKK